MRGWRLGAPLSLEHVALPCAVQEAVHERLHELDGLTRQVLDAAAVVGDVFTFAQVQQVCGRSDLETVDALDTLVAHRLLIEEPERYRFRHILVQVAVYRDLGHHRRRLPEGRKG